MSIVEFLLARIAEDETEAASYTMTEAAAIGLDRPGSVAVVPPERSRMLTECAAKRAIIEKVGEIEYNSGDLWTHEMGEELLAHLGAVYADHPDYREEWRP